MMKTQSIEFFFKVCPHCTTANPNVGAIPFRCRQCGYVQFFGPVAAVGALVVNEDQKLLLVRRARDPGKGKWGLPGGFVDRDESIEEALAREVMEETQLQVVESRYLMSHPNAYDYRGILVPVIDFFFRCDIESFSSLSLDVYEVDHHEWVRPSDAHLEQMAFHSNRLAIEHWLSLR